LYVSGLTVAQVVGGSLSASIALPGRSTLPSGKSGAVITLATVGRRRAVEPSASTIKNMIRDREIAVVRRGTRLLITRKAIDRFFESNEA